MIKRRTSKQINIGEVVIGGGAPVVVQSMTSTDTRDVKATVYQIRELEEVDCELVRVAVPDAEAARAIAEIKKGIEIPLIADIHFDHRLALMSLEAGADGLRLNPGNIGEAEKVKAVALAAKERGVPIRIGVNAGSLPKTSDPGLSVAERMVEAAGVKIRIDAERAAWRDAGEHLRRAVVDVHPAHADAKQQQADVSVLVQESEYLAQMDLANHPCQQEIDVTDQAIF